MSKKDLRDEADRLVREAIARNIAVKQGKTRLEVKCGKCGAPNRVLASKGEIRVSHRCKECGHQQMT